MLYNIFHKRNYFFIYSLPFILCFIFEIFQGIANGNDASKIISHMFCIYFVLYFFYFYKKKVVQLFKFNLTTAIFLCVGIAGALGFALWNGYGISKDITAIFRSLFIGWLAFSFSSSLSIEKSQLIKIIGFLWGGVSFLIFISWGMDIGISTYVEYGVGHKFYFQSVNELTFVYILLWLCLFCFVDNVYIKIGVTFFTVVVFMLIGNKAFIPLLVFSLAFNCWQKVINKKYVIVIISFVAVLLAVTGWGKVIFYWAFDFVTYILVNYSQGGEKLAEKLKIVSPFSALVSQRDMLWGYSIDLLLYKYNYWEIIFGRSFTGYGETYGIYRGLSFSFAENDILDIFMSYGILGIVALFNILNYLWKMPVRSWVNNQNKVLVFVFVLAGFMTGHVMLFCFPVFVFSFLMGAIHSDGKTMG